MHVQQHDLDQLLLESLLVEQADKRLLLLLRLTDRHFKLLIRDLLFVIRSAHGIVRIAHMLHSIGGRRDSQQCPSLFMAEHAVQRLIIQDVVRTD